MSQGWNRQLQNMNRIINEYAKDVGPKLQGFQLGESGPLKTGKTVPTIIKGAANTAKTMATKPGVKGIDPVTAGAMLLDKWFGTDRYGISGPGKVVLQQTPWGQLIYGKPQPDPMMVKAEEEARRRNKEAIDWFANKFGKGNNKSSNRDNNLPPLEVIGDGNIPSGSNTMPIEAMTNNIVQPSGAQLPSQPQSSNETIEQQPSIQAINEYVQQLRDINKPYVNALQDYLNNYDELNKRNYNAQRYWAAMSGLANNSRYTKVADVYNPLTKEANKIAAIKQMQDAEASNLNAINEMMGNLAAVQEMGLTPETAFANKNLLTMMAAKDREENKYRIALENNLMKKYGIDRNFARALAVQALRNQGALNVANVNAQAFGLGGYQTAPGLTQRGNIQNQTAQQQLQNLYK